MLAGDDALALPILALGGHGVISVAANLVPRRMADLVAAALRGDFARARTLHYELAPLAEALFLETNPVPAKRAAEMMGLAAGRPRLPLAPLGPENEARLKGVLRKMRLLKGR